LNVRRDEQTAEREVRPACVAITGHFSVRWEERDRGKSIKRKNIRKK
jgi:hypothetical protein